MKAVELKEMFASKEASISFFDTYATYLGCVGINKIGAASFLCEAHNKEQNLQINASLSLYDYRVGETKDVFDYIIDKGLASTFKEAVEIVKNWLGYSSNGAENYTAPTAVSPKKEVEKEYYAPYSEKVLSAVKYNAQKNFTTFQSLLKGLMRGCNKPEIDRAVALFDIGLNNEKDGSFRLFIPEYWNGQAWNAFRYNRNLTPKGKRGYNRKINLFMPKEGLSRSNKPVILAEGHSDCIVLNAKGIDAISTGSATQKINQDALAYLASLNREIHIYPDADIAGLKGALEKAHQLKEAGIPFKIFWWATKVVSKKSGNALSANELLKEDELFLKSFKKLPKEVKAPLSEIEVLIKSKPVKQGYDFIDFFQDFEGTKALESWTKRYVS